MHVVSVGALRGGADPELGVHFAEKVEGQKKKKMVPAIMAVLYQIYIP